MNVDEISDGIVIDHIKAGRSMEIYHYLHLEKLDCCIAIIKNVRSSKYGKKDIIKIDAEFDVNLDILGYIDPNITVNIIKNGKLAEKKKLSLPRELKNVLRCSNPRCITTTEQEISHVFFLADETTGLYRCRYCETAHPRSRSEF
jgi:aspartate carbamoyltransferase regulatory subunit